MTDSKKPKPTSYLYGMEYQFEQANKYRNRHNSHWKFRIDLAHSLVNKYSLPRLRKKQIGDIIVVDVGCSIGTFAIEFARLGYRSWGMVFDAEALEIAKQLCDEENVSAEFVQADISDWKQDFPPIDIAICFDIFEHLHDDELGSFLQSIRKQLSEEGSLVFHTFPTQYDYIFFGKGYLRLPLTPFRTLSTSRFNRVVKAYASLIDIALLVKIGSTYKEAIKSSGHCNPTTKERLKDILERSGYDIVYMESSQLYSFQESVQKQFSNQPISHRNLYGVAVPRAKQKSEIVLGQDKATRSNNSVEKNGKPKVSVIMSVYNGEKYLREAIESILNQTFTDFEFVIVNDGSTDNSLEILKSYDDERIRVINNEKNIGLTKSLNKALKVARGEYIARQDADDVSLPDRFEEQMKYFERYPEVALLGTSIYLIDENGKIVGKRIVLAKPSIKDLFKGNQFNHGSVMFKKEVINQLGGYNELIRYSQDYELWLRIAKHCEVRNLTQLLYNFRSHDENIGFKNRGDSALYFLLAQKITRNNLDDGILKTIENSGIESLYSYLNKSEKMFFHKDVAHMFMCNNNLKRAREEYRKIFGLNPFDIENNIIIILSYLGNSIVTKSYKAYVTSKNFLQHLKNYWYSFPRRNRKIFFLFYLIDARWVLS
jgi:glycosyltransferase involved in cell wall biosynthesis/2-polyprenyl-3-methyl-5-hydroxy-6-metoxy-1,4-benzoquinol methylase